MSGNYYFVIIGAEDHPLFELEFGAHTLKPSEKKEDHRHLNQFIVHAALDVIDEQVWTSKESYLKNVDKFNEWHVSAFVTAGHVRLVLLHDTPSSDAIKNFFTEVYEIYIKILLNPFYKPGMAILSRDFNAKVKSIARRYL